MVITGIFLFFAAIVLTVVNSSGLIDVELNGTMPIPVTALEGTNFVIYRKKQKWAKAYEYCHMCAGRFAIFPNVEMANMVRNKIYEISTFSEDYDDAKVREEFGLDRRYFFGLRDEYPTENEWQWVANPSSEGVALSQAELKSLPWYPGQPDHSDTSPDHNKEHCAGFWNPNYYYDTFKKDPSNNSSIQAKHSFNDFPCDDMYYFICEKTDPVPLSVDHCNGLSNNETGQLSSTPPPEPEQESNEGDMTDAAEEN